MYDEDSDKPKEITPEKPTEPPKVSRMLAPALKRIIEEHLIEHPGMTREEVLEEIEAAGF